MNRSLLLWPTPILVGITTALFTVMIGNQTEGYGFPLAWRTGGCPPPGIVASVSCFLAIGHDWLSFGLDAILYTLIGYGLLLAYTNYAMRPVNRERTH